MGISGIGNTLQYCAEEYTTAQCSVSTIHYKYSVVFRALLTQETRSLIKELLGAKTHKQGGQRPLPPKFPSETKPCPRGTHTNG